MICEKCWAGLMGINDYVQTSNERLGSPGVFFESTRALGNGPPNLRFDLESRDF